MCIRDSGNGNALLNYTLDAGHVLTASRGKDISMLPFNQPALDLSEFSVAGREAAWFDVFAWAGRDLYRPGETVRINALLRDNDGKPTKGGQPIFLRLKQPDGKTFRETRLEPGAQGYFSFTQAIPVEAPTGRWLVEFRTDPASKEAVQGMTCLLYTSIGAVLLSAEQEVLLISDGGTLVRTRAAGISRVSRNTQGVTLMRLGKGEKLQAVEALDASLDEDEDVAESASVAVTDTPSPQA